MTTGRYLGTVLLAVLGIFGTAAGAVMLWLTASAWAGWLTVAGGSCYMAALILTARPRL
jgi:hypothetical protein